MIDSLRSSPISVLARFFLLWVGIGLQSFGGGAATLAQIRQTFVSRQADLTEVEFVRDWAICQIAPGINLFALALLIGRRLHGRVGAGIALVGLLLPSCAATILITAAYAGLQNQPWVRAAARGVLPATIGLGMATAWRMGLGIVRECRSEGRISFSMGLLILLGGAALGRSGLPVLVILATGGGAMALYAILRARTRSGDVS